MFRREVGVIPPDPLDMGKPNMEQEWRSFRNGFEFYEFASGLRAASDAFRVANLLSLIGKDALGVFHSMGLQKRDKETVQGILNALEAHFVPGTKQTGESDGDESQVTENDDEEEEEEASDVESQVGIVGRFKAAQAKKLEAQLTEEQLETEEEVKREQLAAIFALLKRQQDELNAGQMEEEDLEEQLNLYLNR